jgi:DNA-binding MarR family transcriptional regulator
MIVAYPGLSSADLARLSLLTPPTITVIVGNLRKIGAVEVRPHADHGRINQLFPTESGRSLRARCRKRVSALEAKLEDGLSEDEVCVLRRWLVRIAQRGE